MMVGGEIDRKKKKANNNDDCFNMTTFLSESSVKSTITIERICIIHIMYPFLQDIYIL